MWYISMMKYYRAIKKNETLHDTCNKMEAEIVVLNEVGQTPKEIQWQSIKNKTNH